jgi:DNA-binding MarR family transcriptional regulator
LARAAAAPPAEDPVSALLALGHAFRGIENALGGTTRWQSLDLTMGQLKAVVLIVDTGGVSSRTLAEQLGTTPSAITPLVDRLIEQKLVRREPDSTDRRVIWVRPTARAMALHQTLMHTRRPVLQSVWAQVPAEHRDAIHRSLELLLDAAEQVLQQHSKPVSPQED